MHCLWGAKQAMAHTLISMPVWNCLFLMSHTPWMGVAIALFCKEEREGECTAAAVVVVAGGRERTHPASVQDGGRLQHAAVDLRHLVPHHHAKLPHVRVRVEVGASHLRGRKEK